MIFRIILITTICLITFKNYCISKDTIIAENIGIVYDETLDVYDDLFLHHIECLDELNCILTCNYKGNGGLLIRTTDGGKSWFHFYKDTFNKYRGDSIQYLEDYSIEYSSFLSNDKIFSIQRINGDVLYTLDNGQKWKYIKCPEAIFVEKFKIINEYEGFVLSYTSLGNFEINAPFLFDINKEEWNEIDIKHDFYDNGVFSYRLIESKYFDKKIFSIAHLVNNTNSDIHQKFLLINDLTTNEQESIKINRFARDITFLGNSEIIQVGGLKNGKELENDTAMIYKSYDGGKKWVVKYRSYDGFLRAERIYNYENKLLVVIGRHNNILISKDRGETWRNIDNKEAFGNIVISDLAIASENVIFYSINDKLIKWVDGETSVVELPKINDFNIYPNPVQDYIVVNPPQSPFGKGGSELASMGISEIEIYNVLGEKVITQSIHPMTSSHRMNVEALPAGVYFIKIGDRVEKFVKE